MEDDPQRCIPRLPLPGGRDAVTSRSYFATGDTGSAQATPSLSTRSPFPRWLKRFSNVTHAAIDRFWAGPKRFSSTVG
ncbi:hypothetical protein Bpfe_018372 [Biomphalaria pfeifferi]|uniref:Uncharacterized protein n=1 Tax=Biomphalaria pfeifferi TaxID=112525 RepID=A0AAD8BCW5_BIOPF|nr:hypothetical protein Bpfe_018372 [Biomphalaria pfeifferi]